MYTKIQVPGFGAILYVKVMWISLGYSFILQSVLRQVCSLFQSEFSAASDLVLPLSLSSIFSIPKDHLVAAYAFFLVVP
jgi:hypothetical protein